MTITDFARSLFGTAALLLTVGCTQTEVVLEVGDTVGDVLPLTGINTGPQGKTDHTLAYQELGVTAVRTHDYQGAMDMAYMYPERDADPQSCDSYRFGLSDDRFQRIVDGGFQPYLRLGDSYGTTRAPAADELDAWIDAGVQVVDHFAGERCNGLTVDSLQSVEIWNEPSNPVFWPEDLGEEAFFDLYVQTALRLRSEHAELAIGGPGFQPSAVLTAEGKGFVKRFLAAVEDADAPLDFLSWHLYSDDPQDFVQAAAWYRQALDSHGFTETELHVTEWNTADATLRSTGEGAARLTAAWIAQQEGGVTESMFFRGASERDEIEHGFGLLTASGERTASAEAFSLWSTVASYPLRHELDSVGGLPLDLHNGLYTLAASDGEEHALLLANTSASNTVTWSLPEASGGQVTVVDEAGEVYTVDFDGLLKLPPHTTQLVRW